MRLLFRWSFLFIFLLGSAHFATAQQIQQAISESQTTFVPQAEQADAPMLESGFIRSLSLGLAYSGLASEEALMRTLRGNGSGGNYAAAIQIGNGNSALLQQFGRSNIAVMQQIGNGNVTTLLQEGVGNVYSSTLTGDHNELNVQQLGNNNSYTFDFTGDDLEHSVVQEGDAIRAMQIGTAHRPVSIEQRGSGMDVIIRHNGAQ